MDQEQISKPPASFEKQVDILLERGVTIENKNFAKSVLQRINYYKLTAYLLPFKLSHGNYSTGCSFQKMYDCYEFDSKLRNILLRAIEHIEISAKTGIAYYHAHEYSPLGYKDKNNFKNVEFHESLMKDFDVQINKNRKMLFVKHHIERYDGKFPFWVAIELFSLGMVSKFFYILPDKDKRAIDKLFFDIGYEQLQSWLKAITILRNRCAHSTRLYYYPLGPIKIKKPLNNKPLFTNYIFDIVYIMQFMYISKDKWYYEIIKPLDDLFKKYENKVDLCFIGFSNNWIEQLGG